MHPEELRRIAVDRIGETLERASRRHLHGRTPRNRRPLGARLLASVVTTGSAFCRCAVVLAKGVARGWRLNREVQERLYDAQHPWEHEGPLRWQGRGGHARLVGSHLPTQPEGDAFEGRAHGAA